MNLTTTIGEPRFYSTDQLIGSYLAALYERGEQSDQTLHHLSELAKAEGLLAKIFGTTSPGISELGVFDFGELTTFFGDSSDTFSPKVLREIVSAGSTSDSSQTPGLLTTAMLSPAQLGAEDRLNIYHIAPEESAVVLMTAGTLAVGCGDRAPGQTASFRVGDKESMMVAVYNNATAPGHDFTFVIDSFLPTFAGAVATFGPEM